MAKAIINRGSSANDGTGDNLREGANKVNLNFDEIYAAIGDGTNVDGTIKISDDTSTAVTLSANGEQLRIIGGTAITSTLSGNILTIAADTSSLLTSSGTATLSNKTVNLTDNTVTGTLAEFNTAVSDATLVSTTGSETLTNKTINAPDNTVTNISNTNLSGSAGITNANLANSSISITGDDSSAQTISLGGGILFTGGSGITTSVSGNEVTFATDGSIVTETSTDTLTNKTINGPDNTLTNIANGSLVNSTITLGDDAISLGGTQTTVTNLSLDGATGTIDLTSSGNKIRFNFATDGDFPTASTYEGMYAWDVADSLPYVADDGGWVKILTENASVGDLSNVNISGVADGNVLVWSSAQGRFNAGSAASELTVQEEGSSLTTAATTLNFVGSAVTASGTGATKTITITGGDVSADSTPQLGGDLDAQGNYVQDVGYVSHRSPDATVTQTLIVTVASKTSEHTAFGDGSGNGYLIDGHEGAHLDLSPGVYKFDQADSSNSGHPLRFYDTAGKNAEYTTNVTTAGTPGSSGAYTQITITKATPSTLHYQCTAHANMGGVVSVLGSELPRVTENLTVTGNILPGADDTYDLGASGNVWANIYTGDLNLSNEAKEQGNDVDGTKGNWTIQEGAEDLFLINNNSGKKYKFKLEEI